MPEERLKQYSALVEAGLERYLPQETCRHNRIFEACRYSLLAGGKHIRAALLLACYRLCGGQPEDALPFAWTTTTTAGADCLIIRSTATPPPFWRATPCSTAPSRPCCPSGRWPRSRP